MTAVVKDVPDADTYVIENTDGTLHATAKRAEMSTENDQLLVEFAVVHGDGWTLTSPRTAGR